jgi:hypothetical protein
MPVDRRGSCLERSAAVYFSRQRCVTKTAAAHPDSFLGRTRQLSRRNGKVHMANIRYLVVAAATIFAIQVFSVSNSTRVRAAGLSDCISFEHNSITSFLVNRCNQHLNVAWIDQGTCAANSQGYTCLQGVRGGDKQTISRTKGHITWVACAYPSSPSHSWNGTDEVECQ